MMRASIRLAICLAALFGAAQISAKAESQSVVVSIQRHLHHRHGHVSGEASGKSTSLYATGLPRFFRMKTSGSIYF